MASLPPSFPLGTDPFRVSHPNAPAAGCGPGNARLSGPLCGATGLPVQSHADAPAHHVAWYESILGEYPGRAMAVYSAITGAHRYLARALIDATGMELHAVLAGILPSLLIMVAVLALSTTIGAAAGAALGALAFGIGAAPGAVAGAGVGLEVGTALLEWLGLAFLVVYMGKSLLAGTRVAATAVARAWHSVDQPPHLRELSVLTASHELATAVALVFRGVLQGVVAFLLAKGVAAASSRVPELVANLRKSRLGGSFAGWVEHNWGALVANPRLRDRWTSKTAQATAETTTPSQAAQAAEPQVIARTSINPTQFKTKPNEATFWSGLGPGGANKAADVAGVRGGTTLEQIIEARKIDMPIWDASDPASVQAWQDASRAFSNGASGDVTAVLGDNLRPGNIWESVELPVLKGNPNVTSISSFSPITGATTRIWP